MLSAKSRRLPIAVFVVCCSLVSVAPAALGTPARSSGPAADVQRIEHLIAEYARSIDGADTALAAEIWSASPEVSFIHPQGHEHGLDQIKRNVYLRAMGETFSERQLRVKNVSIHVYGDAAWAEFNWDFTAKFRKDGSPVATRGRETQIYHKEQGGWRLVHVHYSAMPVIEERKSF